MRLNKFISETGICSRRGADAWIEAGRVSVNGAVATLGTQVDEGDDVRVDGEPVGTAKKNVCIAFHKPVGITCTTERHIRGNIIDFIDHPQRIFPIGRLDKDSEGLILLTNDGDIVNPILRSENGHEKEYIVTVDKPITDDFLHGMASGVAILDTVTQPCVVTQVDRNVFRIILTQGLNRQIRRMCNSFGYVVRRLQRVRIVNIQLHGIARGQWRDLTADELQTLLANKPVPPPRAPEPPNAPNPPAKPNPWHKSSLMKPR
jgi:23S rRNA pseudouridine2604 synthase